MVDADVFLAESSEVLLLFENMHFGVVPNPGDCVEVDGKAYAVAKLVHTPSIYSKGTKLRVILRAA